MDLRNAPEGYLSKLVQKGYKVAIGEQVEDPKTAKGLVKREVIRVVTPGTITNSQALEESKNNYLMGIVYTDGISGISVADVSTGDYLVTEVKSERNLIDEIYKFSPSEIQDETIPPKPSVLNLSTTPASPPCFSTQSITD